MGKIKTGPKLPCLPLPVSLVGANVNGKPNFNTIAWLNLLNSKPPLIGLSMSKGHHTFKGIKENNNFSINIPSIDLVELVDYCGIYHGFKVDKSEIFKIFYGKLNTAPMIEECPINIECKLFKTVDLYDCELIIGEIVETYSEEKYLTNKSCSFEKIQPFIFQMPDGPYWKIGEKLAEAWSVGKNYKP